MKHLPLHSLLATILAFASGLRAAEHSDALKAIAEVMAKHKASVKPVENQLTKR